MDELKIVAEARSTKGTSESRRLRRDGWLPGVIYRGGGEPQQIKLPEHAFVNAVRHHASENILVNISVDKAAPLKALMRDVQHHPVRGNILHIDFYEVAMDEKLKVDVAIILNGTPIGVTKSGGTLEFLLHTVELECLPGDLVEQVEVDVSEMEIGDRLVVGDLGIDTEKVSFVTATDVAICAVSAPRVSTESEDDEEDAADATPEVIGEKAEEGGEG